jgi:hypothetical protein
VGNGQILFCHFPEQIQQVLGIKVGDHSSGVPKTLATEVRPEAAQIGLDLHKKGI